MDTGEPVMLVARGRRHDRLPSDAEQVELKDDVVGRQVLKKRVGEPEFLGMVQCS
jgi:hypothetical protein